MTDAKQTNFEDVDFSTMSIEKIQRIENALHHDKSLSSLIHLIRDNIDDMPLLLYIEKHISKDGNCVHDYRSSPITLGLRCLFSLMIHCNFTFLNTLNNNYRYADSISPAFKNVIEFLMIIREVKNEPIYKHYKKCIDYFQFDTNASFPLEKIIKMLKQLVNIYGGKTNRKIMVYMYNLTKDMYDSGNIVEEHIYFLLQYADNPHKLLKKVRDISTGHSDIIYLLLNKQLNISTLKKQDIAHLSKNAQKIILAYRMKQAKLSNQN